MGCSCPRKPDASHEGHATSFRKVGRFQAPTPQGLEGHKKGASLEVRFKALYIQPFEIGFNVVLDILGGVGRINARRMSLFSLFLRFRGAEGLARLL